MRNSSFLIPAILCLLAISLGILPVAALPEETQARITISASSPGGPGYIFGDEIRFSGINTGSGTTYLFLAGSDLSPSGSQIDSADPRMAPVNNGMLSTFRAVEVGGNNTWSWTWDTHRLPLATGAYTVYAVTSPRDALHLGGAVYDSIVLNFTEPPLTAGVRQQDTANGKIVTIAGTAGGHPPAGIAVWIIGPEYSDRVVVMPDAKGSWSYDIDSTATHLLNGTYHVFAEHPSADEAFDFDLNGDYLFNNVIRSNIFTFRGNGRLYGEAAYTAFTAAINGPRDDDVIVPASFVLGTGPAAAALPAGTVLPDGTPGPSGNGSTGAGTMAAATSATIPAANGSGPAESPADTGTGAAAPGPGTAAAPAGGNDGGSMPSALLAGIAGIVLVAAAGGAVVLYRRTGAGTAAENAPAPARQRQQDVGDRNRTGGPGPATTVTAPRDTATAGTPAQPALPVPSFPEELTDKYTGITPVGSGGFAMVYSAFRTGDHRKVAVKIPVRSDERTGRSFLHEIRVWESLHHPNIVEVLTTNILPVPYVEMEFVPGSLEGLAKPVDTVTAARIVRGIAEGIRYAHAHRCIHRDIKPQNILLSETLVPKITDWGISKVLEERTKKTTLAGFSLSYAAPEQIAPERFGSTDERTDIWQIGAVFYELVTGSTPFYGDSMMEIVNETLDEDPIPPSDYNPDAAPVEHIILKCLAKDPAQRYRSADELLAALDAFLENAGSRDRLPG
jgi:hypothetical protein